MKHELRTTLRKQRAALSEQRREVARTTLLLKLLPLLEEHQYVLSFASLPGEIDLSPLNQILANEGRLLLPRIHHDHLEIYRVCDPKGDLIANTLNILEPDPTRCSKQSPSIILVPGLAFDSHNHRIGYGKGYYDRLLQTYFNIQSLGVGFKEQFVKNLPTEAHDHPLTALTLV